MSDFATAILRDFVKKLLGVVFVWIGAHFVAIPAHDREAVTNWAVLAVTTGFLFAWSVVVHWLETRQGNGPFATTCRALARLLMLGIKLKPVYTRPAPVLPQPVTPIRQVGPNGEPL